PVIADTVLGDVRQVFWFPARDRSVALRTRRTMPRAAAEEGSEPKGTRPVKHTPDTAPGLACQASRTVCGKEQYAIRERGSLGGCTTSAWTGWYWLLSAEPEGRPGHVVGSDLITSAHEFDLSCSRFQTVTGSSGAGAQRASRRITSSGQSRYGYRDRE